MKIVFILANSADPDEMPPCAVFHLGLTVCRSTFLPVSRVKGVRFPTFNLPVMVRN